MHLGSCDMTIFGERVSSKEPTFDKNVHNLLTQCLQFNKKCIFAIVFGNDVTMMSSVIVGLSITIFSRT